MLELPLGRIQSVLCLGAHGDDIEIGAGGTLRAIAAAAPDVRVTWVVFSATAVRAAEARTSARAFLPHPASLDVTINTFTDSFFPSEFAALKGSFETLKATLNPDLVLTHYRDDRHQDHRVVSDLTWNTFRDHLVLEYEIPKFDGDLGQPNYFVPIDADARAFKIDAILHHYGSQRDKQWFTRETFEAIMRLRGVECRSRTGYAEAFYARKIVGAPGA